MSKKGFTLAEMLITVTILGLIILIVTPNITGLLKKMDDEKYQRFLSDVFLATEAYIQNNIEEYPEISEENNKIYIYFEQLINAHYLKSDVYDPKNKKRVDEENFTVEAYLNNDDEYSYKLYERRYRIPKSNLINAPTGATYKGVVYLDPTDVSKVCTEAEVNANVNSNGTPTEIKTGCMKWYIYDDRTNYKMILDHNTTADIPWDYRSGINVAYELSEVKPLVDDLITVSGWKVPPRLITAEEVATIVGKTNWSDSGPWFYFDTLSYSSPSFAENEVSKYDWLYNNTIDCKTNGLGCSIEDNNEYETESIHYSGKYSTYGYWTSTIFTENTYAVWYVGKNKIDATAVEMSNNGIRPVIEVPKSLFN